MPDISRPGKVKSEPNDRRNTSMRPGANFSILYLIVWVGFLAWFLFDTWVGQHTFARLVGYKLTRLDTPDYRLVIYTLTGGALGGVVNGMRSAVQNYKKFDRAYIWKYITAPVMGFVLALFVYAITHTSIAVLGGGSNPSGSAIAVAFSNFAIGALAGYGAKDVFIWLDYQVNKLFQVPKEANPTAVRRAESGEIGVKSTGEPAGPQPEAGVIAPPMTDRPLSPSPAGMLMTGVLDVVGQPIPIAGAPEVVTPADTEPPLPPAVAPKSGNSLDPASTLPPGS